MRSISGFWALLLLCAVLVACSSSAADVSCDDDDDCFSGEICHSSVCVPADQVDGDAGIEEDAGVSSGGEDGGESGEENQDAGGGDNASNGGSANDADVDGGNEQNQNHAEHACTGSAMHCDRPDHLGFNDSYSIYAGEITGLLNDGMGCGSDTEEFEAEEKVTDVFSLCNGDSHYYDDRFWRCPQDYFVVATIEPESVCPVEIAELHVTVPNSEGSCDSDFVECTTEADGTRKVTIRARHDAYYNDFNLRLRLDDVAEEEIEFDYRVRLESMASLD